MYNSNDTIFRRENEKNPKKPIKYDIQYSTAAICQEAGMQAVRRNRYVILPKDFETGWKEHAKKKEKDFDFYSL